MLYSFNNTAGNAQPAVSGGLRLEVIGGVVENNCPADDKLRAKAVCIDGQKSDSVSRGEQGR